MRNRDFDSDSSFYPGLGLGILTSRIPEEDLFLEIIMCLKRKPKNQTQIQSEDFCFKITKFLRRKTRKESQIQSKSFFYGSPTITRVIIWLIMKKGWTSLSQRTSLFIASFIRFFCFGLSCCG